jgi:hypothetical protein
MMVIMVQAFFVEFLLQKMIICFYNLDDIILNKNYSNKMHIDNKMNHIYAFGIMQ